MLAAKKTAESKKILHELIPLNSLSLERFEELSEKIVIEAVKAGHYLFRKGDRDNQTIFLLDGTITLIDGFRKVAGEIHAGTEPSRHPVSNQQPRMFAARAVVRCVIARIDSGLLDVFLTWDPSNVAMVVDIGVADNNDWMTRMLQCESFVKLPPSMLQALLTRFKPVEVVKGQIVIAQGSEGEHFYTIHEGRCVVTRRESPEGPDYKLAELGSGDSFGEESLVSESRRNATVKMLTDGLLMCLAKQDFVEILKTQLVKYVNYEEAKRLIDQGAVWIDVRTADEYERNSFEDSVNIPLSTLRGEMPELVFNSKYIICCDTGSRSDSAAFVLSHKGFDVCVLEGGIVSLSVVNDGATEESELEPGTGHADMRAQERIGHLMDELEQERQVRQKVELQLQLVRGELAESGEKLGKFYARVNRLEEDKRQFADRLEVITQQHADQIQVLSEELEQEKIESHKMHRAVIELQIERDDLQRRFGSEKKQHELQELQMQQQLDIVLARAAALEEGGYDTHAHHAVSNAGSDSDGLDANEIIESLHVEFDNKKEEVLALQNILHGVVREKHKLESQLQQLTHTLGVMHDSLSVFTESLADSSIQISRGHECNAMSQEGVDIDE